MFIFQECWRNSACIPAAFSVVGVLNGLCLNPELLGSKIFCVAGFNIAAAVGLGAAPTSNTGIKSALTCNKLKRYVINWASMQQAEMACEKLGQHTTS